MQIKRGIKIKTKQTSLVSNIVNFFKNQSVETQNVEQNQQSPKLIKQFSRDVSPRSTTPRRKIFNKTPDKAGRISYKNSNNDFTNNKSIQTNNKSTDAAYQLTFNQQNNRINAPTNQIKKHSNQFDISTHQLYTPSTQIRNPTNISNETSQIRNANNQPRVLSPRKVKFSSHTSNINPLGDTQFTRLILEGTSRPINQSSMNRIMNQNIDQNNLNQNMIKVPQKTYLNDDSSSPIVNMIKPQKISQRKIINPQNEIVIKISQQLQHHKRLNEQLKKQNQFLKRQNDNSKKQIQFLRNKLTTYENSININQKIQMVQLDCPKSPFQNHSTQKTKTIITTQAVKKSIPTLPQTSHQYQNQNNRNTLFRQQEMKSIKIMNRSHETSKISSNGPSIISSHERSIISSSDQSFEINKKQIIVSPIQQKKASIFIQVNDCTLKPRSYPVVLNNKSQVSGQSRTIPYIKGEITANSQISGKNPSQLMVISPFQQIASDSNKFYFSQSKLQNKQELEAKRSKVQPYKTKQWVIFQDESLKHQTKSIIQPQDKLNIQNLNNSIKHVNNEIKHVNNSRIQDQNKNRIQHSLEYSNSLKDNQKSNFKQKLHIDDSMNYQFVDFDLNQEEAAIDFF